MVFSFLLVNFHKSNMQNHVSGCNKSEADDIKHVPEEQICMKREYERVRRGEGKKKNEKEHGGDNEES